MAREPREERQVGHAEETRVEKNRKLCVFSSLVPVAHYRDYNDQNPAKCIPVSRGGHSRQEIRFLFMTSLSLS